MQDCIKLLRVKHYIKNFLIFIPMFFGGEIFNIKKLGNAFLGFLCFSLVSSAVYVLNDLQDVDKDRNHPTKKNRPIASGKVTVRTAVTLMIACLGISLSISIFLRNWYALLFLVLYFCLNLTYSLGLKNKPIIDVVILASGFVIRIFYGGFVTDVSISAWLYLVVVTGSLYMGLGKRRNELKQHNNTRDVLKYYNVSFLDKNMYVCVALANIFYALWTMEISDSRMIWTIPIFIIILMCYSLDAESDSDGDPVEVILQDKVLIGIIILYAICIFSLLYIF